MKLSQFKRYAIISTASLFITVAFSAILLLPILDKRFEKNAIVQFIKSAERIILDIKLNLRGAIPASSDIVIAAIDEASLESLGRWPWPRKTTRSGRNRCAG